MNISYRTKTKVCDLPRYVWIEIVPKRIISYNPSIQYLYITNDMIYRCYPHAGFCRIYTKTYKLPYQPLTYLGGRRAFINSVNGTKTLDATVTIRRFIHYEDVEEECRRK